MFKVDYSRLLLCWFLLKSLVGSPGPHAGGLVDWVGVQGGGGQWGVR